MRGRPITPPGGGLDVGQYDRQVKETKAQKTREYRDMLDQVLIESLSSFKLILFVVSLALVSCLIKHLRGIIKNYVDFSSNF